MGVAVRDVTRARARSLSRQGNAEGMRAVRRGAAAQWAIGESSE